MALDPRLRDAIMQQPAHLRPVLAATALVESGGRLDAVGDQGRSHGPYQEFDLGRGSGIPVAQRRDPVASTQRAAREFQKFYDQGHRGAELAFRAQRPANRADYISKVNRYLDQVAPMLQGGSASTAGSLYDVLGNDPTAPTDSGQDPLMQGVIQGIQNRGDGESIFESAKAGIIQAALQPQQFEAPAVSPEEGMLLDPEGFNTGNVNSKGGAVIQAASQHLGVPYSWGGGNTSGPTEGFGRGKGITGFDCSSLVQYAYAKMGVNLPRVTYDQIKVGRAVDPKDPSQWQPGDLVFTSPGHVQLYAGNGQVVEAPRTGGKVQRVPMRGAMAVRRVL